MEGALKRKVTVKLNYNEASSSRPPSRITPAHLSRPPSPIKPHVSSSSSLSPLAVRPKAKVNSSAATRKTSSLVSSGTTKGAAASGSSLGSRASASTTPRALSPCKLPPQVRSGAPSPTFQPKGRATVRSTLRPYTSHSALGTLDSRPRSLTETTSDVGRHGGRSRHGSVSLHHAVSFSSLDTRPPSEPGSPETTSSNNLTLPEPDLTSSAQVGAGTKIKSKVSGLAKQTSDSLSPSPTHPPTRSGHSRTRAPSISSNTSFAPSTPSSPALEYTFYPITTATAAANPHRFATARTSPSTTNRHHYQPFPTHNDLHVNYSQHNSVAKVDPATIPLPPQSPPNSVLSFSSRSSMSRSSVSYAADSMDSQSSAPTHLNGISNNGSNFDPDFRSTLDNLVRFNGVLSREDNYSGDSGQDRETDGEGDTEERKVKAEAKSVRKIADLEITNRSLLAINASLEKAKHQQAKEIRELRRKLRESRLILPPRAYRAVKSSLDHDDTADEEEEEEEEEEDDDENAEEKSKENTGDEAYKRIKILIEGLLNTGKRALEAQQEDFPEGGKGVAKVLSAEEVRTWRDSSGDISDHENHPMGQDEDANLENNVDISGTGLSPSHIAVPDSGNDFGSEDEVEAMMFPRTSAPPHPRPPPILVTGSP